jgi:hypothetical protein
MKRQVSWLMLILVLVSVLSLSQTVNGPKTKETDTFTFTSSGTTYSFNDSLGTLADQWEVIPSGGPATLTVTVSGCMRSSTCGTALATSSGTSSQILSTTGGPYDYYSVAVSWTGGTNVTVKINRTGSAATIWPLGGSNGTVNSGNKVIPTALGQIASTQVWMPFGLSAPALATGNTGGNIAQNHTIHVVVTYNTPVGETLPSVEATITTAAGTGSNTVTVTAPTLPSGYVGYTVYDYDFNAGGTTWLKQTTAPACVNITTNCVISTVAVGGGIPTVITAWPQPPNIQAFNGMLGEIPGGYFPKADGNYYPWLTVDWSTCGVNFNPCGTPTFTHRTFFTDFGNGLNTSPAYGQLVTAQSFSNAFVSMNHLTGVNTSTSNQDRTLGILLANPVSDATNHYGMEAIQAELDLHGSSQITGSPDGEAATGSFQMSYQGSGNQCGSFGCTGIRTQVFREAAAASGFISGGLLGIHAIAENVNASSGGSQTMIGAQSECIAATTGSAINCMAINVKQSGGGTWTNLWGIYINDLGSGANIFNMESAAGASESGQNYFDGKTYLNHIQTTGPNRAIAAPTCSSTGTGTTPSCSLAAGSNDSYGKIIITAGTTPGASGTATLTYNATYSTNATTCIFILSNAGTGSWNARASLIAGAQTTTSAVVNWDNNAASLIGASTYQMNYHCGGI